MAAALDPAIAAFFDALLSADNAVRQRAEAQKDQIARENPAALIAQLAAALAQAPQPAHRAMAAVLMRRVVGRDTLGRPNHTWQSLAPAAREQLKAGMLQAFLNEPVPDVRKKVCHAVAELATVAAVAEGGSDWPALLPAVFAMSGDAADAARREASLFMFTTLTEFTGDNVIAPHCLRATTADIFGDAEERAAWAARHGGADSCANPQWCAFAVFSEFDSLFVCCAGDGAPLAGACRHVVNNCDEENDIAGGLPAVLAALVDAVEERATARGDQPAAQAALLCRPLQRMRAAILSARVNP